jgi:exodeoxyribonuclease VII small subunit
LVACGDDGAQGQTYLMPRAKSEAALPDLSSLSYEQALAELEQLVERMDEGRLPLDDMLNAYRRGADLLAHCRSKLAAVEEQVKVLEDGQLKPLQNLG